MEKLYEKVKASCEGEKRKTLSLNDSHLFDELIELFGPALTTKKAKVDLRKIYRVAFHVKSGSLIVANRGVTILCHSPLSETPYITRHIACSLYKPDLGVESINMGIVGDIYSNMPIVRAESACPPAFLFGSQRCNCHYQWASVRELAAHFNPIQPPSGLSPEAFESWVQSQFIHKEDRDIPLTSGRGVVLMHLDSQAGMGSGYTEGEFTMDLYNRALMRQLGENSVEEQFHTSIFEGYSSLGIRPDSRGAGSEAGYQVPAIALDFLGANPEIVVLSNNKHKIKWLESYGFNVHRVKSLGKVGQAGRREASERGRDFAHLEMDGEEISFEEELNRLKQHFAYT